MAIRKIDLRDFIETKGKARKEQLRKTVYESVKAVVTPIVFEKYAYVASIERQAQRLHDGIVELQGIYAKFDSWSYSNILRDLNRYLISFRQDSALRFAELLTMVVLGGSTEAIPEWLLESAEQIKKDNAGDIKAYKDLAKLTSEILTVIDSCRSGDKAYKQLTGLGVDLTGFNTGISNLPAIVKLSVDPGLLSGAKCIN